jgi:hypothetical protein
VCVACIFAIVLWSMRSDARHFGLSVTYVWNSRLDLYWNGRPTLFDFLSGFRVFCINHHEYLHKTLKQATFLCFRGHVLNTDVMIVFQVIWHYYFDLGTELSKRRTNQTMAHVVRPYVLHHALPDWCCHLSYFGQSSYFVFEVFVCAFLICVPKVSLRHF